MEKTEPHQRVAHVEEARHQDPEHGHGHNTHGHHGHHAHDHDLVQVTSITVHDEEFKMTFGKFMAILSFQLGYFSDTFIVTMVSTVLSVIDNDLGPSTNYIWIITSITVAGAAVAPIVGRFSDIYGRRNFLIAGNLLGMIGTVVAATAHSVNAAIAGGVLVGVASSMRQLAWACLGEIVPKKDRGIAFAFLQQSLGLASAFGGIVAYGFIQNGSWRPVYWFPFALDTASLILVFLFYRPMNQYIHEEGKTTWDQLRETDFIGTFLYIAGVVLFLIGISFGGSTFPWASAGTIAPIVLGFCLLIGCGLYEAYADQKWAIFPPEIFRNFRGFTVLQIATFLLGMLFYSIAVLWPAQVAALYATENLKIGWYCAAGGFGGVLFPPFVGYLQRKVGHSRWQLLIYTTLMTICCGCLATSTPTSNVSSTVLVVLTFGFVASVSVFATSMVQVGVKHEHIGIASGMVVTMRTLGGAVATTIYLTILHNQVTANIPSKMGVPLAEAGVPVASIPAVIVALSAGDITSPALAGLSPTALHAGVTGLKAAYAASFRTVYLVSIAFGVIGTVLVAFAADVDHLMTKKVDVVLAEGAHIKVQTDTGEGHIIRHIDEKTGEPTHHPA